MISIFNITGDLVTALNSVIPDKAFPMLAPQGTTLPFITHKRTGFSPTISKDGECELKVNYDINIVTKDYSSGVQDVDLIRAALLGMTGNYTYEVEIVSSSEEAFDDGYAQYLSIVITATV